MQISKRAEGPDFLLSLIFPYVFRQYLIFSIDFFLPDPISEITVAKAAVF